MEKIKNLFHKITFSGFRPVDAGIFFLYLLYFRVAIAWIVETFLDEAFYEYGIAFVIVLLIIGIGIYKKRKSLKSHFSFSLSRIPLLGFLLFLLFDGINVLFLHHNIISALCFFLGFYSLLGFYLPKRVWNRGIFVVLFLSMMLPFLVHIQTFLGFPLRILTAKIISFVLQFLHIANVSESTIIITENNATSIDLPCSGVKSIYAGTLFLCVIFYLKKVRISFQMLGGALIFYFSLVLFNIWRVFSLVYVYDVLKMKEFGDTIHVILGLLGFTVSCLLLWYLTGKYIPTIKSTSEEKNTSEFSKRPWKMIIAGILLSFFIAGEIIVFQSQQKVLLPTEIPQKNYELQIPDYALKDVPFTPKEQGFFVNREIEFSKKYEGYTPSGRPFSLLIVASKSWKSHHNPEICLQGLGYHIDSTEIYKIGDIQVRKVLLDSGEGTVVYWFMSKEKTLMDYSERIWEGVLNPNETWALVEVGFAGSADMGSRDVQETILDIHKTVQQQMKL